VGYPFVKKGWKLYDLENKKIYVSRDVEFLKKFFLSRTRRKRLEERG